MNPCRHPRRPFARRAKILLFVYAAGVITATWIRFPRDVDRASGGTGQTASFYEAAYVPVSNGKRGVDYEETARQAAERAGIEPAVRKFVNDYRLEGKRVLEVGSGRGYLQDLVDDYTGLDLSPSVAPHYHKRFVAGSATAMPFPDSSFDAVWSVWVIEHISEPERALTEIRRVLKPGGVLFLYPAWNCSPWAADGFDVRPYEDFNWRGKLVKASLPFRRLGYLLTEPIFPIRAIRRLDYECSRKPTRLKFLALNPNYEIYWQPDSDAAISLDRYEAYLWFRSRGDECLDCGGIGGAFLAGRQPLIVRTGKRQGGPMAGGQP